MAQIKMSRELAHGVAVVVEPEPLEVIQAREVHAFLLERMVHLAGGKIGDRQTISVDVRILSIALHLDIYEDVPGMARWLEFERARVEHNRGHAHMLISGATARSIWNRLPQNKRLPPAEGATE